jgi:hypothetical protein
MKSPMLLLTFFASISTVTAQSLCDEVRTNSQNTIATNCAEEIKCQDACFNEFNTMLTQSNIQALVNICEMTPGDLRKYLAQIQVFDIGQKEKCGKGFDAFQTIIFENVKFAESTPAPIANSGKGFMSNSAYLCSLFSLIGVSVV